MLDCKILTTEAELDAIADEWRQLYARVHTSPIANYDLFRARWDIFGRHEPCTLHITVGYREGKLAGVLPLTVLNRRGIRFLQSDSGGDAQCDMLADNPADAARIWQVTRQSPHYDVARIKGACPQTPCHEQLRVFAHPREEEDYFFLNLHWPNSEEWLASLSKNARRNFRRYTQHLEEKGPLTYEVYQGGPVPSAIIEGMIKHKLAWAVKNDKHGFLHHANVIPYYRKLAEAAADQGLLFLAWLKCGDAVIGYSFGLVDQNVLHSYVRAHDAAYAKYSAGELTEINMIRWAIDNNLKTVNHLYTTGTESEKHFKAKYANDIRHGAEYIFSNSLRGKILETLYVHGRALKQKLEHLKNHNRKTPIAPGDS